MVKINSKVLEMFSKPGVYSLFNLPFKGRISFDIARLKMKLTEESKVYSTTRQELLNKYKDGDINDEGMVRIKKDKQEEFLKENEDLSKLEFEINIATLNLDPDNEDLPNITPNQWEFLMHFMEDKKEE